MKTTLKVLYIVLKVVTIFFSIIGMALTAKMIILAKPAVCHVDDVFEECEDLDPNDEDQNNRLVAEACRRTMADPRAKGSFVHAVDYCVGKFVCFVANL